MKTLNLNTVTLKKNGAPIELMGITNNDKWEIIAEGVLAEASALRITKDNNGNDLALKKGVLKIITGDDSVINSSYCGISNEANAINFDNNNSVRLYVGGTSSGQNYIKTTSMKFDTTLPSQLEIFSWQNARSRGSNLYIYGSDAIATGTNPNFLANEFEVDVCRNVFMNFVLPVGTKWRLLGVRA